MNKRPKASNQLTSIISIKPKLALHRQTIRLLATQDLTLIAAGGGDLNSISNNLDGPSCVAQ